MVTDSRSVTKLPDLTSNTSTSNKELLYSTVLSKIFSKAYLLSGRLFYFLLAKNLSE